jgi:hypothetical protein
MARLRSIIRGTKMRATTHQLRTRNKNVMRKLLFFEHPELKSWIPDIAYEAAKAATQKVR